MATTTTKKEQSATSALDLLMTNATGIHGSTASDKGGVGKSFWNRFKVEFLRAELGREIAAYDGDGGTGSSIRILGERDENGELLAPESQTALKGVKPYNVRKERAREEFLNSMSAKSKLIQHDLPGGAFDALTEIADGGGESLHGIYEAIVSENYLPVIDHVIHHEDESTESVARYLDATEGLPIVHVAILNMRDADSKSDFELWYGYADENGETIGGRTRDRLLERGGFEIVMPKLAAAASSRIKRYNLTFKAACTDKRLTVAQRAQVSRWVRDMTKALMENDGFRKLYKI